MLLRTLLIAGILTLDLTAAEPAGVKTLRAILLEQLRTTHDSASWFVPANTALAGITPKQASWSDGKGNHSIGQLASHLLFWNQRNLAKFNGEQPASSNVVNDETFNNFDSTNWPETV